MTKKIDRTIELFGFSIFGSSQRELLKYLQKCLSEPKSELVTLATPNPEQIMLSRRLPAFRQILRQFDVLIPDGVGLVWASHRLAEPGQPTLLQRITGVDVLSALLAKSESRYPVLIIGGRWYDQADGAIATEFPGVWQLTSLGQHVYWTAGYQRVEDSTPEEERAVLEHLAQLKPKIVALALGAPHQENWIISHRQVLEKNRVVIAMSVGGAVDMLLGLVPRAPEFLQKLNLEWLYRLAIQPWRWRRQLVLLEFVKLTLTWKK